MLETQWQPSGTMAMPSEKIPGDFFTIRAGSTVLAENLGEGSDGEKDEEGPVGQTGESRGGGRNRV